MRSFEGLSIEELFAYDNVTRFKGKVVAEHTVKGPPDLIIDESADIERFGEDCKALLGPEQTNGFRNVVEMMEYMADRAELPEPRPLEGNPGVRELEYV